MEYCFTFTSASQEFPQCVHGALSVKALIGLVTLTSYLEISSQVTRAMCFHPANLTLPLHGPCNGNRAPVNSGSGNRA